MDRAHHKSKKDTEALAETGLTELQGIYPRCYNILREEKIWSSNHVLWNGVKCVLHGYQKLKKLSGWKEPYEG